MNLTHLVAFKFFGGASADVAVVTGCFFDGEYYESGFFCGGATPATAPVLGPAGAVRDTKRRKRKRVVIGDKLYEVESLRDVEFLLKRLVREEAEPATKAAKARVRVVDRVRADPEEVASVRVPIASAEVDWSALWVQLAMQETAYAEILERVLARQEEDDLETILMLLH